MASHPEIIAIMTGYEKSALAEEVIGSGVAYFLGLSTSYSQARRLTPNTLLTLPDREVQRFFPQEPIAPSGSVEETVREMAEILTNKMELWNEENAFLLSLSVGIDSRVSLAATREISENVEYYSWIFPNGDHDE